MISIGNFVYFKTIDLRQKKKIVKKTKTRKIPSENFCVTTKKKYYFPFSYRNRQKIAYISENGENLPIKLAPTPSQNAIHIFYKNLFIKATHMKRKEKYVENVEIAT